MRIQANIRMKRYKNRIDGRVQPIPRPPYAALAQSAHCRAITRSRREVAPSVHPPW
jgi:hypothetical protein